MATEDGKQLIQIYSERIAVSGRPDKGAIFDILLLCDVFLMQTYFRIHLCKMLMKCDLFILFSTIIKIIKSNYSYHYANCLLTQYMRQLITFTI